MEFQQDNRAFCAPQTVLNTVAEQLADVDFTLPDYCPDIEKILKCTLSPQIRSKTLSGGLLQVDGACTVSVLYVESAHKTIRCCEQSVEFSQSFTVRDAGESPLVLTKTKPEYINCRALSPRRLVMHGAFSLYATVIAAKKTELFTPQEDNLEVLWKPLAIADLQANCQEQFTVSEEISVADKPAIESVLYSKVGACVTDTKAAGGKLLLNGEISIRLFYLTNLETGETAKLDYLLPFTQMIDCEGIEDGAAVLTGCEVMNYDVRLKNDILSDKPAVAFDAMLCVSVQGYQAAEREVAADAYCTAFACAPSFASLAYTGSAKAVGETFIEKLTANIDSGKISKVLDIYADNIALEAAPSEKGLTVRGKLSLCILALGEDSFPVFAERSCDFEHVLGGTEGCNALVFDSGAVPGVSYRLSDDNSIDIRCELKISGGALQNGSVKAVTDVQLMEDRPLPPPEAALTLYFASEGERLWDIAKSHNTRLALLQTENAVEGDVLGDDKMLLIPTL